MLLSDEMLVSIAGQGRLKYSVAKMGGESGGLSLYLLAAFALAMISLGGCGGTAEQEDRGETRAGSSSTVEKQEGMVAERMSLQDAVGQMFVVAMGGTEPDYYIEKMVRERNIGGVLLFGYNMESEQQTRELSESLQTLSLETDPAIPLFIAVDQEGGEVSSAPWVTPQPPAAEVGSRADPKEARAIAGKIGRELLRAGVNTDLAPVVDTGFGAAIGDRSFGEDPELVAAMGAAAVEGFRDAGVVASAKHYPNHGPATADSHESVPVVDHGRSTIESYDLPPFRAAIEAGVPMVMVGHLVYPAIDPDRPASLSPEAIGMLREDLGFDGVVVTDDLSMDAASGDGPPAGAAVQAVKAGADLLLISSPPQQQADAYDAVVAAVESGEIPRERIDKAVDRIMKIKENYPLYGKDPARVE